MKNKQIKILVSEDIHEIFFNMLNEKNIIVDNFENIK